MHDYLSPGWVEAIDAELRSNQELTASCGQADLVVQQIITDGPSGDVAYCVILDSTGARATTGLAEHPHVTLRQTHQTAVAVYTGSINALDAVQHGQIELIGDAARLQRHRQPLGLLESCFVRVGIDTADPD